MSNESPAEMRALWNLVDAAREMVRDRHTGEFTDEPAWFERLDACVRAIDEATAETLRRERQRAIDNARELLSKLERDTTRYTKPGRARVDAEIAKLRETIEAYAKTELAPKHTPSDDERH